MPLAQLAQEDISAQNDTLNHSTIQDTTVEISTKAEKEYTAYKIIKIACAVLTVVAIVIAAVYFLGGGSCTDCDEYGMSKAQ